MNNSKLPTNIPTPNPNVFIHDGKAITTSRQVTAYFGKQHFHVIEKIKNLECSEQFLTINFSRVPFEHNGNVYEEYEMTKDGFVFLVMGFTGKKAAQFKEAYIAEFNRMEAELYKSYHKPNNVTQEEIDAYNVNALAKHYEFFYAAWKEDIFPILWKIESPLAAKLVDRFKDGYASLTHIKKSLNGKLSSNQKPRLH